ncbi:S-adenosyl-L-methionine-dependent methyltransferases superfamily protein [Striga hermonthica]|uniref:S-adenosyl-L-methionine-dependent methyltransferases superfamily protein n=1 Tax=Striga hermonthica TaxID=68872 RepID=A0A9N7NVV5_STRHE|nr:S-adenosyl-L-methionine-dependent methyltransferases superfamily protein [Striga hermonthica]
MQISRSVLNKDGSKWTGSYWDEFVALPPVVPEGPIAIFGLGGGTAAHLMLDLWPSLQLDGWEIDEIIIDQSRDYLGLRDLEKHTMDGGFLNIHIGDVFSPDAAITGGYAGIIVDLFAGGKVLPQLEQAATWRKLHDKLMPNGRFMVNCGAGQNRLSATYEVRHKALPMTEAWRLNPTIRALCQAFPGQVNWKKLPPSAGENYLALTGSLPDMTTWSAALPHELKTKVNQWRFCYTHDS